MNETISLTNLDTLSSLGQCLLEDVNGDVLKEYVARFEDARAQARSRLLTPLTREDHEAAKAIAEGSEVAVTVVKEVWAAMRTLRR